MPAREIVFSFKATTRAARRGFRQMRRGLADVRRGAAQTRQAFRDLRTRNGSLLGSFTRLGGGVGRMGLGMLRFVSGPAGLLLGAFRSIISIGRRVFQTIAGITLKVAALSAAIGTKALMSFGGFERGMVRLRATIGATGQEWERVQKTVTKVIRESEFMPRSIVEAANNLAQAGVKTADEFEAMLPAAREFATVLGLDINRSAEILLATMKQFKLPLSEATDVVTVFANAQASSRATAEKLSDALGYIGFTASEAGQSLRDTAALIDYLLSSGVEQGSMAGTILRNVFMTLRTASAKEGTAAAKALEAAGIELDKVNLKTNDFMSILRELQQLSDEQFAQIFNVRGIGGAEALVGNISQVKEYRQALDETGRVQRTITALNATLAQRFDVLKGSVEGAFIALGGLLERSFSVGGRFSSLSDVVNQFADDLSRVRGESVRGLFRALFEDITSGRMFDAALEAFKGFFEALIQLAIPAGLEMGKALWEGISSAMFGGGPEYFDPKTGRMLMDPRKDPMLAFTGEGAGVRERFAKEYWRLTERERRRATEDLRAAGLDIPAQPSPAGLKAAFERARARIGSGLIDARNIMRSGATAGALDVIGGDIRGENRAPSWVRQFVGKLDLLLRHNAAMFQDNRRQTFYGVPSENAPRRARGRRTDDLGGAK
ncbi:MAG: phage tail tape measure protein [Candidatus Eisenbacteria bacterium]|nr:phage tail tape measure protein [Candidatus Eisenbacteria bacterium]